MEIYKENVKKFFATLMVGERFLCVRNLFALTTQRKVEIARIKPKY